MSPSLHDFVSDPMSSPAGPSPGSDGRRGTRPSWALGPVVAGLLAALALPPALALTAATALPVEAPAATASAPAQPSAAAKAVKPAKAASATSAKAAKAVPGAKPAQAATPVTGAKAGAKASAAAKGTTQAKTKATAKSTVKAGAADATGVAGLSPASVASLGALPAARQAWLALTPEAARLAQWVRISSDNHGQPFAIIDKRHARLFVFDPQGSLRGNAPVLLGLAPGDHSVPGIGERPIGQIKPEERTTPAGRFQAEHGLNANGEDIIWVDYDAAVSMHRVRPTNPKERRLQRLASETVADNRISYGCINVPKAFYEQVLLKHFAGSDRPVVYVLPEQRSLSEVFAGFPGHAAPSGPSTPAEAASPVWVSVN